MAIGPQKENVILQLFFQFEEKRSSNRDLICMSISQVYNVCELFICLQVKILYHILNYIVY